MRSIVVSSTATLIVDDRPWQDRAFSAEIAGLISTDAAFSSAGSWLTAGGGSLGPVRIAVSGAHGSGKTTLVEDFVAAHPDYVHEPEPYEWLAELYGEPLSETPEASDFRRQLELSVGRLRGYARGARVIAERSPVDFLAYILAFGDLRRGRTSEPIAPDVALAAQGMEHVDLLVVLPLVDADGIVVPESEDLDLREAMNDRLLEIVTTDEFQILRNVRVLEVHGARRARLAALEQAL